MDLRHTLAAQLIRQSTPWRSVDAVAARAGVSLTGVMGWWVEGQLFALTDAHAQPLFPDYAFDRGGRPRIVVGQLWKIFQQAKMGPWELAAWMLLPHPGLRGRMPLEVLDEGSMDLLIAASHTALEHAVPSPPAFAPLKLP